MILQSIRVIKFYDFYSFPLPAVLHHAGPLNKAVRQGGLAVVDMGDDAEVANVWHSDRKNRFLIKTNSTAIIAFAVNSFRLEVLKSP